VEANDLVKREATCPATDIETGENMPEDDTEREFAWLVLPNDTPNGSRRVAAACAVCLSPYDVGDTVTWSPQRKCQHAYHSQCIEEWLARKEHSACPCCRQEFCYDNDDDYELASTVDDEEAEQQEDTVVLQESAPSSVGPEQTTEAAPL
jgi:hypothetical protein